MADRRRINGPAGLTSPPVYEDEQRESPKRLRPADSLRSLYLRTAVTPSASGSAYLELEPQKESGLSGMKLTCTVHGPRSLPRSIPFSPYMMLSTHVKYAPFATRHRRGYLRDASERDLSIHLETALRGVIIADRWPKSGVDVVVTVIEGEQSRQSSIDQGSEEWDMMNVLGGCVTVASAALVDAGIDCVDIVSGGVAALVAGDNDSDDRIVLDPIPSEHQEIVAACCVAYLPARDELTNLWLKGRLQYAEPDLRDSLVAHAVRASKAASHAITASLLETSADSG